MTILRIASVSAAAVVAALLGSGPARAAGCGGYVNLAVWGCAPWDNNPPRAGVTPGYRAPAPKPAVQPRVVAQPPKQVVAPAAGGRIISDNSGGVIGANRGGIISDHSSGLRR
jgi:hypothetical protein